MYIYPYRCEKMKTQIALRRTTHLGNCSRHNMQIILWVRVASLTMTAWVGMVIFLEAFRWVHLNNACISLYCSEHFTFLPTLQRAQYGDLANDPPPARLWESGAELVLWGSRSLSGCQAADIRRHESVIRPADPVAVWRQAEQRGAQAAVWQGCARAQHPAAPALRDHPPVRTCHEGSYTTLNR